MKSRNKTLVTPFCTSIKWSKNINFSFLKEAYSKLKSGAIALCHNAFQPSFQKEAKMFVEFTDNTNYFNRTATISIDEMGLEFSIKK